MIGRLQGRVAAEEPTGIVLDVQGVGYEVAIPAGTLGRAVRHQDDVELWVHTVLRSDALELFGFATEIERRVFRLLIVVPNVGPRTAIAILSVLSVSELASAVGTGDTARLTRVPGIGKKTAERLVLELKGKAPLAELPLRSQARVPEGAAEPGDDRARLTSALVNMGYRPAEADRAVQGLGPRVGKEPLGELLREALARLSS